MVPRNPHPEHTGPDAEPERRIDRGRLTVDAVLARDYPVVQGGILMIAAIVITVNLIVDLLYGVVNPRIRHG